MFERILNVFLDALKDSAITLPILFLCYLLIEFLEEKLLNKYQSSKALRSRVAPVFSAGIGLIPQCGFSIVASDLYSKRIITIGSLFAIFIATSDEALPIMLSNPNNYASLAIILAVKFCYAVIIGLVIDLIFTKKNKREEQELANKILNGEIQTQSNIKTTNHEHKKENKTKKSKTKNVTNEEEPEEHSHKKPSNENSLQTTSLSEQPEEILVINSSEMQGCCKHNLEHEDNKLKQILWHPLKHSLTIFAYILVINLAFGLIVEFVGEDVIANFLSSTGFFEPFIAAVVGLIPNCAASVIITEVFIMGGISLGSCVAGLCINSGLAIVMLFKMNKNVKENLLILFGLYAVSTLVGIVINLI